MLFSHQNIPECHHTNPSQAGGQSYSGQTQPGRQQGGQHHPQGDMSCGADDRDIHPAPSPEVVSQPAAQKVKYVEAGHQPEIAHSGLQAGAAAGGQHQSEAGLRPQHHHQRHKNPEHQQQLLSLPEALPDPTALPRPGILAHKDGHRRRAAVAEGVGKALHPRGGGKGVDGVLPQGVYCPLD